MSAPIERRFVPTTESVKVLYMNAMHSGNYASFVERNEHELGFEQWLAERDARIWKLAAEFVDEQREDFDGDLRQVRDRLHARAREYEAQ